MNIGELLGAMVQAGMSPSAADRMRSSLGGGGALDSLAGMLGGQPQKAGGGLAEALSGMLGGSAAQGGGGLAEILSGMLGDAGRALGGKQNLALGGLGALVGALLGGGGKSVGGALGGGLMALLGAMAFNALKGSGQQPQQIPLGLLEPQTEAEATELERNAELILRAMIDAAKADGRIDEREADRLVAKIREAGADADAQRYLMARLQEPMETESLIAAVRGKPDLAAQIYGAALLAIEVDTPAERVYLDRLAAGMGLPREVAGRIEELVGLQPA